MSDDDRRVNEVSAVAKLYAFAVLEDVLIAVQKFQLSLIEIKSKYRKELSAGDEQFALLLKAAEHFEPTGGAQ